jgi:hypothetical protein
MTQTQLNKEFTKLHTQLEIYTGKALYALKSSLDVSSVIAECYIHLDKNRDLLETPNQVESFSKNWIKMNIKWPTSPINRRNQLFHKNDIVLENQFVHSNIITDIEAWITEWENSLSMYDKRLWSIYYIQEKTTGRLIADHLNISISSGFNTLRECKRLEQTFKNYMLEKL